MQLLLFQLYSYFLNIIFTILDLLPFPFRFLIFKIILKKLGRSVLIDYKVYIRFPEKVIIGDRVAINRGCQIYATYLQGGAEIIIEDNVALSPNVILFSAGQDYQTLKLGDKVGTIKICKNSWIGGGAIILPGVEIGEGSIIGAGSIVTKNIPPYSIAIGSPARVIKKRVLSKE